MWRWGKRGGIAIVRSCRLPQRPAAPVCQAATWQPINQQGLPRTFDQWVVQLTESFAAEAGSTVKKNSKQRAMLRLSYWQATWSAVFPSFKR